jgi:hypothetical protein
VARRTQIQLRGIIDGITGLFRRAPEMVTQLEFGLGMLDQRDGRFASRTHDEKLCDHAIGHFDMGISGGLRGLPSVSIDLEGAAHLEAVEFSPIQIDVV